jgi:hypothetical protein
MLEPGSYYVRVLAADSVTTGYALRVAVTAAPSASQPISAIPAFNAYQLPSCSFAQPPGASLVYDLFFNTIAPP